MYLSDFYLSFYILFIDYSISYKYEIFYHYVISCHSQYLFKTDIFCYKLINKKKGLILC